MAIFKKEEIANIVYRLTEYGFEVKSIHDMLAIKADYEEWAGTDNNYNRESYIIGLGVRIGQALLNIQLPTQYEQYANVVTRECHLVFPEIEYKD
jgi:hypothetical protein